MKKPLHVFPAALLFVISILSFAQEYSVRVPYVPTPEEVVEKMIDMAEVDSDDVLYDLGCGDGRIVVTAAKKCGASGFGFDINPERITESWENARRAEVKDKVMFLEEDLFEADLRQATVVTLYLLTSVNKQLRPKLYHELKPGTRIVSHNYGMGEWKPDNYTEVPGQYDIHKVFFWVMPANASGTWKWTQPLGFGMRRYELRLDQEFQEVEGSVIWGTHEFPIRETNLTGNELSFCIDQKNNGGISVCLFEGCVDGNVLNGKMTWKDSSIDYEEEWRAIRDPLTMTEIDR